MLNSLHHRDCVTGMHQLGPRSVDLVFADPPFNIGYAYDVYNDERPAGEYLRWTETWLRAAIDCLVPHGTLWIAMGDEYVAEVACLAKALGLHLRNWVVWHYGFGVHCNKKFSRSHTHLLYFVRNRSAFTFHGEAIRVPSSRTRIYRDRRASPGGRIPADTWILHPNDDPDCCAPDSDTWHVPRVAGTFKERAGFHGCQMPERLLERVILACSNPGDVVLDPFAGSGTTLAVAKRLGRRWVGFEISENYVQRARERISLVEEHETERAMSEMWTR